MNGTLNANQSPRITIDLHGSLSKPQSFEVIIDTGFTGSVSMPLIKALPLGLVLFSTASFILADGSKENTFLCPGMARIDGEEKPVIISLSKGNDILVGTEFLSTFGANLELDYNKKVFSLKTSEIVAENKQVENDDSKNVAKIS